MLPTMKRWILPPLHLVLSLALAVTPLLPAQAQLPALGDTGSMTLGAERKLGDQIADELYRDPDYLDDPVLMEYVQTIWDALRSAAKARGELTPEQDERFAWQIILGRDREVNAFALPGGYMGVYLGLISIVSNRDELASVLGHELSHITQRHISRLMTHDGQQTPLLVAALILAALAASKSPDAASALVVGGQALTVQNQLKFSRDMEREADRVGYGVMTSAGFNGQGFVTMFDKLQQASRLNDNGAYPYLRSHPLTTERIADMQARQQLKGAPTPLPVGQAQPIALDHAMIMARAQVLSTPGVDQQRLWLAEPDGPGFAGQPVWHQVTALYTAALAASQLRDHATASRMAARLSPLVQGDPAALRLQRLLVAEVALAGGNPVPAAALPLSSQGARPELFLAAQARLQGAAPAQAEAVAEVLQTWVTLHGQDALAWQWLSSAWNAAGQPIRAVRAEAEAKAAHYDYGGALDRFKAAQELVRRGGAVVDHVEASIIDSRTRELSSTVREQAVQR